MMATKIFLLRISSFPASQLIETKSLFRFTDLPQHFIVVSNGSRTFCGFQATSSVLRQKGFCFRSEICASCTTAVTMMLSDNAQDINNTNSS